MRKKFNNNGGNRRNNNGGRRYNNNGGNRGGHNDHQNLARQKHHATQMREKFNNLARDAQNNGDRVDVEYYLQHVDHYNRVLADIAVIEAERFAHREQQQAAVAVTEGVDEATGDAAAAPAGGEGEGDAPVQTFGHNQPRMTRNPRYNRAPQAQPQAAQPQAEASTGNDTDGEIPLPGLPTV